jgi:hypothetical protein
MRTKVLSMSELQDGAQGILYIHTAIVYRVKDLTRVSISSITVACYVNLIYRQLLSAETRSRETIPKLCFWGCGLFIISRIALPFHVLIIQFKYVHKESALWTVDYVRSLNSQIIPYNDDTEDQNVQPGGVLNYGFKDEMSLDYSVYDGQLIDFIPNCHDVDPPMKDMWALRFICMRCTF